MAYNIIVSPRAQKEIENAIEYYALYSIDAPKNFIAALKEAYSILEINPFFRVRYKNICALKLKNFPHSALVGVLAKRHQQELTSTI